MDINKLTLDTLKRYYQILKETGYFQDTQVYSILLLTFIADLMSDEYKDYVTPEDNQLFDKIIVCLSKSNCIIPYTMVDTSIKPVIGYL